MPVEPDLAAGIGRNIGWTYLTTVSGATAAVVTVGFAVRRIGPADYGVFVFILAISALLGIIENSVGNGVIALTAQRRTGNLALAEEATKTLLATHALLVFASAVVVVAAVPLGAALPRAVALSRAHSSAIVCADIVAIATAVSLGTSAVVGVARGSDRFRTCAIGAAIGALVRLAIVLLFVGSMGLVALGIAQLMSVLAERGVIWRLVRRDVGWFRLRPTKPTRSSVRQSVAVAGPLLALAFDTQLVASSDSIVIGTSVGSAALALYRIGAALPSLALRVVFQAVVPSLPALASTADAAEQVSLARFLTRVASFIGGAGFALLVVFRQTWVALLLGRPDRVSQTVLVLFSIALACDVMVHPLVTVLIAREHQRVIAVLAPVELVVNLSLTILFVDRYGAVGAAVALLITTPVNDLVLFPLIARREFRPTVASILAADGVVPTLMGGGVSALAAAPFWLRGHSLPLATTGVLAGAVAASAFGFLAIGPTGRRRLRAATGRTVR